MEDQYRTKKQLLSELTKLRQRVRDLERAPYRTAGRVTQEPVNEAALSATLARLEHLLSATPAVIYSCETSGDFGATWISSSVTSQLGYEPREFIEDRCFWADNIHPQDRGRVFAEMSRLFDEGTEILEYRHEYRFRHKDRSYRWMLDQLRLVRDEDGQPLEIVGYWIDITERKRLEQELLEVAVRERKRIGRDLHDDLGQLLTGVALMSQGLFQKLAARVVPEAADAAQIRDLIQKALSHTHKLAKGLYATGLDSDALFCGLKELAAGTQQHHRIECLLDVDGRLSVTDPVAAMHVYCIAREALNNAVKHAKPGRILIRLVSEGDRTTLEVRDDGVGFVYAADKSKGLGLSIMQHRAKILNGSLIIRKGADCGTVVLCSFPTPATAE